MNKSIINVINIKPSTTNMSGSLLFFYFFKNGLFIYVIFKSSNFMISSFTTGVIISYSYLNKPYFPYDLISS